MSDGWEKGSGARGGGWGSAVRGARRSSPGRCRPARNQGARHNQVYARVRAGCSSHTVAGVRCVEEVEILARGARSCAGSASGRSPPSLFSSSTCKVRARPPLPQPHPHTHTTHRKPAPVRGDQHGAAALGRRPTPRAGRQAAQGEEADQGHARGGQGPAAGGGAVRGGRDCHGATAGAAPGRGGGEGSRLATHCDKKIVRVSAHTPSHWMERGGTRKKTSGASRLHTHAHTHTHHTHVRHAAHRGLRNGGGGKQNSVGGGAEEEKRQDQGESEARAPARPRVP